MVLLRASQLFDLFVISTISSYGTKYNKYLLPAYAHARAYARAYVYAPTRTRTHTIKFSYGTKYNKYSSVIV